MNLSFLQLTHLVTHGARPVKIIHLEKEEEYECCIDIEIPEINSLGLTFLKPEKKKIKISGFIGQNWYGGAYFDTAAIQDEGIRLKTLSNKESEGGEYRLEFEIPLTEETANELLKNFEEPKEVRIELPMIRNESPLQAKEEKRTLFQKVKKLLSIG